MGKRAYVTLTSQETGDPLYFRADAERTVVPLPVFTDGSTITVHFMGMATTRVVKETVAEIADYFAEVQ